MIVAIFDVDGTLIKGNSSMIVLRELIRLKKLGKTFALTMAFYTLLHKLDLVPEGKYRKSIPMLKIPVKEGDSLIKNIFETKIKPVIHKKMIEMINFHKKKGHKIILLSTSPTAILKHYQKYLGMDYIVASELEIKKGEYTGKIKEVCYGKEKLKMIANFFKGKKVEDSYFYSDSFSDIEVFELVKNPVAVDPDFKLKRHAKKKNWKIINN